MNQISKNFQQEKTMSSREIAELSGKRHGDVIRDIRAMVTALHKLDAGEDIRSYDWQNSPELVSGFLRHEEIQGVIEIKDPRGYTAEFLLDRYHTEVLVTGYDVKRRAAVIKRWYELETGTATPANLSRMEILQIALESEQARIAAESERDLAIATKAQISSSREASVMGKLSAASRKMKQLEQELGRNAVEATVTAVEKALGHKYGKQGFRPLQKWCRAHDIKPSKVPCPRYGDVAAWPAAAWLECYGVDLTEVFGEVAA